MAISSPASATPAFLAAREIARGPVLGIAEAAMRAATMVATGFSIVTTLPRTKIIARHLVAGYGMVAHCRNIRAVDIPVLTLEENDERVADLILAECRRAVSEDECGAIVLGCAGMTDLAARISTALQVPVIDGVTAAVKFLEALLSLGLATSKRGDLAFPLEALSRCVVGPCAGCPEMADPSEPGTPAVTPSSGPDLHPDSAQFAARYFKPCPVAAAVDRGPRLDQLCCRHSHHAAGAVPRPVRSVGKDGRLAIGPRSNDHRPVFPSRCRPGMSRICIGPALYLGTAILGRPSA